MSDSFKKTAGVCFLLIVLVWAVFGQTLGHDFINCDDDFFVTDNPTVQQGLSADGVVHVFTSFDEKFYYPLTVISFMADASLWGMNPAGFHASNVMLHALGSMLLFLALKRLTGRFGCSAVAAALFAVHPLHVEPVAWVTGRKDVLSGLFFMLTLYLYAGYAQKPFRWTRYLAVTGSFLAGLLAKPMLVTLPLVLLILDGWPLQRLNRRAVLEKIPLLGLSLLFGVITLSAGTTGKASTLDSPDLMWRIGNAFVSTAVYLSQMLWPAGLTMPVPVYDLMPVDVVLSIALLMLITAAVFLLRRRFPYLLAGWLWFGLMLTPVCGIISYLGMARADRFVYLPLTGLLIMAVWGLSRIKFRAAVAAVAILAFSGAAAVQTTCWRDSITLWRRTLSLTKNNSIALNNLGTALAEQGDIAAASKQFIAALKVDPTDYNAWFNLALLNAKAKRLDQAVQALEKVLEINPEYPDTYKAMGAVLILRGDYQEGIEWTRRFLEMVPEDEEARYNLKAALQKKDSK
ncbi:MAG TPA: tetratricopeptide repeat protein [Tichowtungia sp.]|nr:tetratricopeptide repeat protein [Tichowtungia sp.]